MQPSMVSALAEYLFTLALDTPTLQSDGKTDVARLFHTLDVRMNVEIFGHLYRVGSDVEFLSDWGTRKRKVWIRPGDQGMRSASTRPLNAYEVRSLACDISA
ncbi:unnamed protein product, partial [Iphiclides podalirius]